MTSSSSGWPIACGVLGGATLDRNRWASTDGSRRLPSVRRQISHTLSMARGHYCIVELICYVMVEAGELVERVVNKPSF